jgi:NADPH:quinone reductase-like Zn-dependent oxidoreductase
LVANKPDNVSYEEASAIPYGALTALNLLRKVNIQSGQRVLIIGASGSIGSAAVQLAKFYEAQVTGICGTPRLEYVKALGADNVIDYTKEDFTQNSESYDLIFDILGKSSFLQCKSKLKKSGIYLLASFKLPQLLQMLRTRFIGEKKVICAMSGEKREDIYLIKELLEAGKIKAIIDRSYTLGQTVEAHRYFESGKKKGGVVITIENNNSI